MIMKKAFYRAFICGFFMGVFTLTACHHDSSSEGQPLALGSVNFTVTTRSLSARAHFLMGLKYLHNFIYDMAYYEFVQAEQADPNFALSYWGQAMCFKWPLWSFQNREYANKILIKLGQIDKKNIRPEESGLLKAVKLLFQTDDMKTNEKNYLVAMGKLYEHFPSNNEVASFYALSIIGYTGNEKIPQQEIKALLSKASRVLKTVIKRAPSHPGALHYYTHLIDVTNKQKAGKVVLVEDNIAKYLSDSSHVLHMPSHGYMRLGNWKQAIRFNELSISASKKLCHYIEDNALSIMPIQKISGSLVTHSPSHHHNRHMAAQRYSCDAENIYHSLEWLQYAYLQVGKFNKARNNVKKMKRVVGVVQNRLYMFWLYRMQARQVLETQVWLHQRKLWPNLIKKDDNQMYWASYSMCGALLTQGLSAIYSHNPKLLFQVSNRLSIVLKKIKNRASLASPFLQCKTANTEVDAAKKYYLQHDTQQALDMLLKAMPAQRKIYQLLNNGFELPFMPIPELYGQIVLKSGSLENLTTAQHLYKNELNYYPNRRMATQGLAKVAAQLKKQKAMTD